MRPEKRGSSSPGTSPAGRLPEQKSKSTLYHWRTNFVTPPYAEAGVPSRAMGQFFEPLLRMEGSDSFTADGGGHAPRCREEGCPWSCPATAAGQSAAVSCVASLQLRRKRLLAAHDRLSAPGPWPETFWGTAAINIRCGRLRPPAPYSALRASIRIRDSTTDPGGNAAPRSSPRQLATPASCPNKPPGPT